MKALRRCSLVVVAVVMVLSTAACGGGADDVAADAPKGLKKVSFSFSWQYSGHRSPYLLAKQQGFFEDEGLDVTIQEGADSGKTIDQLAAGKVQFAEVEFASLVVAVEQHRPLVTVATVLQTSPQCLAVWADSGIESPKDLEGKTVVVVPGGSDTQVMEGPLFERNDVDADAVKEISADFNTRNQIFLSHKADAMPTFINDTFVSLVQQGYDINCLLFSDFGASVIGNGLAVNASLIEEDPDTIAAFVRALKRGWEYAEEHPDEAIAALVEVAPLLKPEEELPKLEATFALTRSETSWGFTDPSHAQESAELLLDAGLIDQVSDTSSYLTNDFIP